MKEFDYNSNTKSDPELDPEFDISRRYRDEILARQRDDDIFSITLGVPNRETRNTILSRIIENDQNKSIKEKMMKQIYPGHIGDQGKPINIPIDFHKGPFMDTEDRYIEIYGDETKISNNCNENMMKTIGDTNITFGMKANAEGVIWNNGLVCYNKNNIIIRDADNMYGQPGFLKGFFYYDRLAVEIMKRYIVPTLQSNVSEGKYTNKTDPKTISETVGEIYTSVRAMLFKRMDLNPYLTEEELFFDVLSVNADEEILERLEILEISEKPIDINTSSDARKIEILENKVSLLENKIVSLEKTLEKCISAIRMEFSQLEDMLLDRDIAKNSDACNELYSI